MELTVDSMREADCGAVARLAGQLGHPSTAEEVLARFRIIAESPDEQAIVARRDERVVGWVLFRRHVSLASDPRLEILGLVVDEFSRGHGVGTRLIHFAEAWGRVRGLSRCSFSSRVTRADAHRLYLRLGYEIVKTSHFFVKKLD